MAEKLLPLEEVSINELFISGDESTYEIPIYQRNYAWERDEIIALIQDIYDAYKKDFETVYYIGTLVSYHKGNRIFEIIDGQQRLTTIRLILGALGIVPQNKLTYTARKKSDDTLKAIPDFSVDSEKDIGIVNGFKYAKEAVEGIASEDLENFKDYFGNNVHLIHYQVPKDIDLNQYFEIMNSRGEQLEKHEIVKANLMEKLANARERELFNCIWECCSEMSVYVQQRINALAKSLKSSKIFGRNLYSFPLTDFESLKHTLTDVDSGKKTERISIADIINSKRGAGETDDKDEEKKDSFQPIIDFPNFLLIVLKITRMSEKSFSPSSFNLDDKELLTEFAKAKMTAGKVRQFIFCLLKARFLLDNYIVHHSKEEDSMDSNPWKLQVWHRDTETKKEFLKNLCDDKSQQDRLVHLLSMFEVSFTARQRKNYLFYCLMYLMKSKKRDLTEYTDFVEKLANRYFHLVYLDGSKLNAINTPVPGSFDEVMLTDNNDLCNVPIKNKRQEDFIEIYGDGTEASKGVPLFVFNYLDYKIWNIYDREIRSEKLKKRSPERKIFFKKLGCSDFELDLFKQFYFSRTRRSLEHYYPQAMADGIGDHLDKNQINCIGNYAMIGSQANSSGSNWSPKTKLDHYLDKSQKVSQISIASLKFMIMMQVCQDRQKWEFEEIKHHQDKMLEILMSDSESMVCEE